MLIEKFSDIELCSNEDFDSKNSDHLYYAYYKLDSSLRNKPLDKDIEKFTLILRGEYNYSEEIRDSIKFLTMLMLRYLKKQPFILIDEYDVPLSYCVTKPGYEEVKSNYKSFFIDNLTNNEFFQKALCVGTTDFSFREADLKSNNFSCYTMFDDEFSDYFKFTQEEVDQLITNNLGKVPLETREQVRKWFGGYSIEHSELYNPFFAVECRMNKRMEMPYSKTFICISRASLLMHALADPPKEVLYSLLSKQAIECDINNCGPYDFKAKESIVSLLVCAGYLIRENSRSNKFVMPNKEVKKLFHHIHLFRWCKKAVIINYLKSIFGDYDRFYKSVLKQILDRIKEYCLTKPDLKIIINGLFFLLKHSIRKKKHKLISIKYSRKNKKPGQLMLSIQRERCNVCIYKIKIVGSQGRKEEVLENLFWEVYNIDIEQMLNISMLGEIKQIKIIYISVILFNQDPNNPEWKILSKEFTHRLNQVEYISTIFQEKNEESLWIKDYDQRIELLSKLKKTHLYDLITLFTEDYYCNFNNYKKLHIENSKLDESVMQPSKKAKIEENQNENYLEKTKENS
jgi:hypothetical protein